MIHNESSIQWFVNGELHGFSLVCHTSPWNEGDENSGQTSQGIWNNGLVDVSHRAEIQAAKGIEPRKDHKIEQGDLHNHQCVPIMVQP